MAVIPKPASTVVLMDRQMTKTYMTKRPGTMKFLGGFYVFPGGAVEPTDNVEHCGHLLRPSPRAETFSPEYYVAAARELFEEVGIFLGCDKNGAPVSLTQDKKNSYRRELLQGNLTFLQILKDENLHLNVDLLVYFGNFVTPESRPYRFDTRFFLARLPQGQTPEPDPKEIEETMWITPKEALNAYQEQKINLVPPTISSLHAILNFQQGGPLTMPSHIHMQGDLT